jgi:hypothetical protein
MMRVEKTRPNLAHALRVLAMLAPESLPIVPNDIHKGPGFFGASFGDSLLTAEIVRGLSSSGLVRKLDRSIIMHRLVQLLIVAPVSREDRTMLAEEAAQLLATANPGDVADPHDWPKYSILLPHVQALIQRHPPEGWTAVEGFLDLVLRQITYLYRAGRYTIGLTLAEQCEPVWREELEENHPLFLRLRNNKGTCLTGLRRFSQATRLYRDLVNRYTKSVGFSDQLTLRAANNVGVTLLGEEKYIDAMNVLMKTVEQMREVLGADDIETLRAADNLVEAFTGTGDYALAIKLGEQTIARRRQLFALDHPDTLESAHILASALRFVDPDRARTILYETLDRRKSTLGAGHPNTLRTIELLTDLQHQVP